MEEKDDAERLLCKTGRIDLELIVVDDVAGRPIARRSKPMSQSPRIVELMDADGEKDETTT